MKMPSLPLAATIYFRLGSRNLPIKIFGGGLHSSQMFRHYQMLQSWTHHNENVQPIIATLFMGEKKSAAPKISRCLSPFY